MQRGRLPKARARGGAFFKVGLTSVREELSIDLLERLLVDHAAGALLWEGTESAGVSAGRETGPGLGVWGSSRPLVGRDFLVSQVGGWEAAPGLGLKLLCKTMRLYQRMGTRAGKEFGLRHEKDLGLVPGSAAWNPCDSGRVCL